MAYDGWIEYNGLELVNLARTTRLAEALGIDSVWIDADDVAWIETALAGTDYGLVDEAPWYDPNYPASGEFAGFIPLSIAGLDDSTTEAATVEYVTSGGSSGKPRNKTLPIVVNMAIVAATSRGAEYGKRWLDRMLRGGGARTFCAGADLRYFRFRQEGDLGVPPMAHRRDVSLSRGTSVTRKRATECSATWIATYTWAANDPFEYGEEEVQFTGLGGASATLLAAYPTTAQAAGRVTAMVESPCPVYDYSPIYDPLHPALVASPTAPEFLPEGWDFLAGDTFNRDWVRLRAVEPVHLNMVPVITLTSDIDARYVRVSIWDEDQAPGSAVCDPLWTAIISYLPAGQSFYIDGEQEASYIWDGASPQVRRTDSLAYGTGARPLQWTSFAAPLGTLVTLDVLTDQAAQVRASLSLVSKSD